MPWETHQQQQQQLDYYMNVPASSYTNVNFIINNTTNTNRINCNGTSQSNIDPKMSPLPTGTTPQTVPSSTPKSRSTKNSSSPSSEFSSTIISQHKEIYPWMSDKKHGTNKSKSASKNQTGHNTTSTSSSSSSSGKIFFRKNRIIKCEDEK